MSVQNEVSALIEVGACADCLYADALTAMRHNARCIKYAHMNAYEKLARRVKEASGLDMNSPRLSLSHGVCFSDCKPDEEGQIHRNWLVTIQAHVRLY